MFLQFFKEKDSNTVILDKNGLIGDIIPNKKIDIILSPSFYWFIEKKLPVKYPFQAKRYMPSIFEEFTQNQNLSYFAISKKEGVFWLFAYSDREILKALEDNGIDMANINKVYFAQNIFPQNITLDMGNGFMLCDIDGYILRVPKTFIKQSISVSDILQKDLDFSRGIVLKKYRGFIQEKLLYKIILPIALLALLFGVESFWLWQKNKQLIHKKESIFTSYGLEPTSFQNKAILSNLKTKNTKQQNIRYFMSNILKLPLQSGEYIKNIDINKDKIILQIKLKNPSNIKKYKDFFKKMIDIVTIVQMNIQNDTLNIEFKQKGDL